jgi:hypothetical protein
MSIEENKAVMQRIWMEILNEGNIERANELVWVAILSIMAPEVRK